MERNFNQKMKTRRMKQVKITLFLLVLLATAVSPSLCQPGGIGRDLSSPIEETMSFRNAWGIDVIVSNNGFGLGTFYRHEYTRDLAGYADFSISESKDEREIDTYNFDTGETYVLGKINRFLVLPLYAGVQYRLFSEDIMDNFRPYVNAAVGPTMIYVFPYNEEYFTALGKGKPKYTAGGYVGFGAYFGSERSTLLGLNIRYYYVPYGGGLPSMEYNATTAYKKDFGGIVISLNIGKAW